MFGGTFTSRGCFSSEQNMWHIQEKVDCRSIIVRILLWVSLSVCSVVGRSGYVVGVFAAAAVTAIVDIGSATGSMGIFAFNSTQLIVVSIGARSGGRL